MFQTETTNYVINKLVEVIVVYVCVCVCVCVYMYNLLNGLSNLYFYHLQSG